MTDPYSTQGGQGVTEVVNQLTNIARQLSYWSQSITNSAPAATTTASPKFTAVSLSTATSSIIGTSVLRHGIVMHNPGTATCYVYLTGMSPAPSTTSLGGSVVIYPGGTLAFPSALFPNSNAGFSGFSGTGSSQGFTIIEFF